MTTHRYHELDVFASDALSGNPLAVVHDADAVDDATMLAFTQWTNFSEATFVVAPVDARADYAVRIFAAGGELPFAGHPTLGTCAAWLAAGGTPRDDTEIVQECGVGLVRIRRLAIADGRVELAFAAPPLMRSGPVAQDRRQEVLGAFGLLDRSDAQASAGVVDVVWADNGPGWVLVVLDSAAAVLAVEPPAVSAGPLDVGFVGVHHGADAPADVEVRAFFRDQFGVVREDPVTGSLNAAIAQVLLESGTVVAPYVARQGTAVGRAGRVTVSVAADRAGTEQVWVGGAVDVVVIGSVEL